MAEHLHAIAEAHGAKRTSDTSEAVGYIVGLLTWVLAGGVFVAVKAVTDEMPPWTLVFFRLLIATAVLLPLVASHHAAMIDFVRKRWLEVLFIGAIGLGITQGLMFGALSYTTAVTAGIIFAIAPVITLVMARFILREDMGMWQVIGSAIAFLGIVVIAVKGSIAALLSLDLSPGDLIILAAAAMFAAYTVLLRRARFELERLPLLVVLLCGGVVATFPFFIYEIVSGQHENLGMDGVLALLYVAIPGGAVMYLLYNWSIDILGAGRAGGLLYSQMIFTALLAWLILGEPIEIYHFAGAGLIIVGVVLITFLKPRTATQSK
jgi:drug/metabolite transporter (DMT)-like permease